MRDVREASGPPFLYVVATPIGNLGDITRRAVEVLGSVQALACESPTASRRLMSALGLHCPRLIVYREEGREKAAEAVLDVLRGGADVALVSEAGTPGISDPGRDLVERCHQEGVAVRVVPGASSVVAAVSACGLPTRRWTFEGFLPSKGAERRARLAELAREERTMVFLEAPHRLADALRDLQGALGDREAFLGRELTKRFEETRRGTLAALLSSLGETRGECVVIVEGAPAAPTPGSTLDVPAATEWLLAQGMGTRQVADFLSRFGGMGRKEAYQLTLERQERTNF